MPLNAESLQHVSPRCCQQVRSEPSSVREIFVENKKLLKRVVWPSARVTKCCLHKASRRATPEASRAGRTPLFWNSLKRAPEARPFVRSAEFRTV